VIGAILAFGILLGSLAVGGAFLSDGGAVSGGGTTEVVVVPSTTPSEYHYHESGPSKELWAWAQAHDGNARHWLSGD